MVYTVKQLVKYFLVQGHKSIPENWERCLSCGLSDFVGNLSSLNFSSPEQQFPLLEDAHLHNVKCGCLIM